jgi:glycosyltransferase involved in cell wall biosynthesis
MAVKLVYLVTEDWYFVSHRLPMARAARDAGFEVHVATRVAAHGAAIEREGFVLHPLAWERGRLDPIHLVSAVRQVRRLYRSLRPALAHHVALAPTVVGSLAATGLGLPCLNALAGLGFAFTSTNVKARTMRLVVSTLLRSLLRRQRATVLVQNPDDRKALESLGIPAGKIAMIPGSGVDTDRLTPLPEPPPPITVAFVGRLLHDKGLAALIAAHDLLRGQGRDIRLLIAGTPDPANPASIPDALLAEWKLHDGVSFLGHVADIREVWAKAHIAVLPSRREGLPLTLLEAAACGRPLVATDVPGCREIVRPGVNGLLVPADSPAPLADAIGRLANDESLRQRLGSAGRQLVEAEFSSARIGAEIVALYNRMLAGARSGLPQSPATAS